MKLKLPDCNQLAQRPPKKREPRPAEVFDGHNYSLALVWRESSPEDRPRGPIAEIGVVRSGMNDYFGGRLLSHQCLSPEEVKEECDRLHREIDWIKRRAPTEFRHAAKRYRQRLAPETAD